MMVNLELLRNNPYLSLRSSRTEDVSCKTGVSHLVSVEAFSTTDTAAIKHN